MKHQHTPNLSDKSEGSYLCFSLGKEKFAMPLLQVKEVIANAETTNIPQAPPYFRGIINLRGQVISVLDLRSKLKIGKAESTPETTIVILDIGEHSLGAIVDSVDSVASFEADEISAPPSHDSSAKIDFIVGVAKREKDLVLIIDIKKALNTDDMKAVRSQVQKVA